MCSEVIKTVGCVELEASMLLKFCGISLLIHHCWTLQCQTINKLSKAAEDTDTLMNDSDNSIKLTTAVIWGSVQI